MKRYKVMVSSHTGIVTRADGKEDAKRIVWQQIKNGYMYGWSSWPEFRSKVQVIELEERVL